MNFAKCLRTPFFFTEYLWWLLLSLVSVFSLAFIFSYSFPSNNLFLSPLFVCYRWLTCLPPVLLSWILYFRFLLLWAELPSLFFDLIFICYKFNCLYNSVFLSSGGNVSFTCFCINNSCSFSNAPIWSERVLRLLLMFSLCIAFPFRYLWYLLPGTSCIYNFCYSNRFLIWLTTSFSSSPLPSATILFFKLWIWSLLWC